MEQIKSTPLTQINIDDYENVYVVGDIHGELDVLQAGLKELSFSDRDLLICVGDIIDRGSRSLDAIKFILETENAKAAMGNHELMAILYLVYGIKDDYDAWMQSGGSWINKHIQEFPQLKRLFEEVEQTFPLCLELGYNGKRILVSHAAIPAYNYEYLTSNLNSYLTKMWLMSKHEDLENIYEFEDEDDEFEELNEFRAVAGADLTIHGHTGTTQPLLVENRLYIDTRAFKDAGMGEGAKNYLTFLCLNKEDGAQFAHFKKDHFMKHTEWVEDVDNKDTIESINNILFEVRL